MKKRLLQGREINLHGVDSKRVKSFLPLPIEPLIVENIFGFLNLCEQCNFVETCSLVFKIVNSSDFPSYHMWKIAMFLKHSGMKLESEWERRNFYLGVVYRLEGEIQSIKNDCQPHQKYECFHMFNTKLASYKSIVVSIQGLNQSNVKITIVEASFQHLFSSKVSIFSISHESKILVKLKVGGLENKQIFFKKDLFQLIDRDTFRNCILSHALMKHKQVIEEYESGVLLNLLTETGGIDWAITRTAQEGIATGSILIEMLSNRDYTNNLQTLISIKHLAQHYTMTNFSVPMTLTLPFYKKIIHSEPLQYYTISLGFERYIQVALTVTFSGSIEDGQDKFYLRYEANEGYGFTYVSLVLGFENVNKIVPLFYWKKSGQAPISTHNEWEDSGEHYLMKIQELLELKKVPTPCSLVDIMCNYARTRRVDNLLYDLLPDTEYRSGLSKLPLQSITNGIERYWL